MAAVGGYRTERGMGAPLGDPAVCVPLVIHDVLTICEREAVEPFGHLAVKVVEEDPRWAEEEPDRAYYWTLTLIDRV